ncbi:Glycyl-tRNA synthetase beta chain [invertebrate metagenome]|uniref:glycine--tRNA ligase n=1 Tax=invertebrate metagenome TaxID=1711999 RepID=A0A484HBI7_9ZZZZ
MPQLILELLSEEIPTRLQTRAAEDLKRLVCSGLVSNGLDVVAGQALAFVTPRRLTLVIADLPVVYPDVYRERRGPRVDAPGAAVEGFLRTHGITPAQAKTRWTTKGTFYFALIEKRGGATAALLKNVVESVLTDFPWPRSMHWGTVRERWIRPLRRILCTFDQRIVPVQFAGVEAGNMSEGHRFLAPIAFPVCEFSRYERSLREAHVILDPAERAERIHQQAEQLAAAEGLTLRPDQALLDEVAGLVEWPVTLIGRIDEAFMGVPAEVLTATMRTYQKYFSLLKANRRLAPRFLVVSNMVTADGGQAIVAGNERVLRARLADAKFFWEQDRSQPLGKRVHKLTERVFHARLGTMAAKVERMRRLAVRLAEWVPGADVDLVDRAALLAKADLSTSMVGEFPELQGIMGRCYAREDGEAREVCDAIAEHYSPLGPSDSCPSAPVSVCVALADRIDTLVGFWSMNEKPTGSKDPFALRRAALGLVRLLVYNSLRIPLFVAFELANTLYRGVMHKAFNAISLLRFLTDRLKTHLQEKGVRHDLVTAVFALGQEDDLVRLIARVASLTRFLSTKDGMNLLIAYRRATNIVRIEREKDGLTYRDPVDVALLSEDEERALEAHLSAVMRNSNDAVKAERFDDAMLALSQLRAPVDVFFERVTINSHNSRLRENRLRLLSHIGTVMGTVADFAKIEG